MGDVEKKGLLGRVQHGVDAVKQAQAERSEKKTAEVQAQAEAMRVLQQTPLDQGHELFEYRVVAIKSTLVGDKMDVGQVEATLNQWAAQGGTSARSPRRRSRGASVLAGPPASSSCSSAGSFGRRGTEQTIGRTPSRAPHGEPAV